MRHCYHLKAAKVKATGDSKHLRWIVQNLIAATHARYTHLSKVWTGLQ